MKPWMRHLAVVGATAIVTGATVIAISAWLFTARPGEWSIAIRWRVATLDVSVASLTRVATHPLGIAFLDGRTFSTSAGHLRFARDGNDRLAIGCSPCRIRLPALGHEVLEAPSARVTVRQHLDRLDGTLEIGRVRGRFTGRYDARRMDVDLRFEPAPIADWIALYGARIPEASVAEIRGTVAFAASLALPSGRMTVTPKIDGFAVEGLGTAHLAGRLPRVACGGARAPGRDLGRWLPRAVVAAEDQRFWQHPGYDLDELSASLSRNQGTEDGRIERGASTVSLQLARMLFTGGERTSARKVRELLYAVEMERTLGKARILRLYLDVAPWGEGTCGAEAAAQRWFGVPAAKLSGAQAAWLAAMLHAPDREAARWIDSGRIDQARAGWVLDGMRGAGPVTRARAREELASM